MEETLGKRIVAHRKRLGLTQDQLAEKMGITAQAVSKWENDQSCPDISALPQLADIFKITLDALLGRDSAEMPQEEPIQDESGAKTPIFEAVVIDDDKAEDKHHLEFHFNGGKKSYIGPAAWVIAVGIFYLANVLCNWNLTFWEVLWPTSLLIFGLFHLRSKSIFLSLCCILVGGYVIISYFVPNPLVQDNRILWAAIIILFGISLLVDGMRKKKKACHYSPTTNYGAKEFCKTLDIGDDSFRYDVSFGDDRIRIDLPVLRSGEISANFGDYTVDLRGVETVDAPANLNVSANFGELTILVPRRFAVNMHQNTSFSGVDIKGHPDEAPDGTIYMNADVSFGSLVIDYV